MNHAKETYPAKILSDIVMFDGSFNVQIVGRLLKVYYPKLIVMRSVEHTVSLFFNGVSNIPIVNQMISAHKMIYNIFGFGIYQKLHSVFKSKSQEFHSSNIGLFSGNETRMAGYSIEMYRELRMRKVLQNTILSAEFNSIPTNNKFTKAVRYIPDNMGKLLCTSQDSFSLS